MSRGKRYQDEIFDLENIPWKKIGILVLVVVIIFVGVLIEKKFMVL